ncbi:hypothetical protein C0992_001493 [Termitomyces sp. T32_za158]|nr:hypothetical protein C0992_001493 [Termitomyces sp. T32_za158]
MSEARLQTRAGTSPEVSDLLSSTPVPGPSQPRKAARSRKNADPGAPQPEKRDARFKKSCPQNILDRVARVMSQRFFMIDRQREQGELKEIFSVLGSTGNVCPIDDLFLQSTEFISVVIGVHCNYRPQAPL